MIVGYIDNHLKNKIANLITSSHFPWYYSPNTIYPDNQLETHGAFNHIYFRNNEVNSPYVEVAYDLLHSITQQEKITYKSIFRMQSNFVENIPVHEAMLDNAVHRDHTEDKYLTILYYVIDSDGPTSLYKNGVVTQQINPEAGKYIIYPSNIFHGASMPKHHPRRIVFNYIIEV